VHGGIDRAANSGNAGGSDVWTYTNLNGASRRATCDTGTFIQGWDVRTSQNMSGSGESRPNAV